VGELTLRPDAVVVVLGFAGDAGFFAGALAFAVTFLTAALAFVVPEVPVTACDESSDSSRPSEAPRINKPF
jgi:hypothetical protein